MTSIHDPKHPVWPIIRYVVVGGTMIAICSTLYKNGFDPKDLVLIITTLASIAGFDIFKTRVVNAEVDKG
jgi:hypothetical protein